MYTDELLEEKYKAQRQLAKQAKEEDKDYFKVVESEVRKLYSENDWKLDFARRKGSYLKVDVALQE